MLSDRTWQIVAVLVAACLAVAYLHIRDFMRHLNRVSRHEDEGT